MNYIRTVSISELHKNWSILVRNKLILSKWEILWTNIDGPDAVHIYHGFHTHNNRVLPVVAVQHLLSYHSSDITDTWFET